MRESADVRLHMEWWSDSQARPIFPICDPMPVLQLDRDGTHVCIPVDLRKPGKSRDVA